MVRPPISPTHATAPLCASAFALVAEFESPHGCPAIHAAHKCVLQEIRNHCHMVAIYHAFHNFCRVHQTLPVTPAMEAGLADHVWSLEELVGLLDERINKRRWRDVFDRQVGPCHMRSLHADSDPS